MGDPIDSEQIEALSDTEVVSRWRSLYQGPVIIQKWVKGEKLLDAEHTMVDECIAEYRRRLASISWFMKCLNEPIARQANKEDNCTGHFWEGRFTSQPLPTEEALLACMAYIDLNPIRANIAKTPETSDYTSIKERIKPCFQLDSAVDEQIELGSLRYFNVPLKPLSQFEGSVKNVHQKGILFSLTDYLQLVDYTGRAIVPNKRGAIPINTPPILQRLCLDRKTWLEGAINFEKRYLSRFLYQNSGFRDTG